MNESITRSRDAWRGRCESGARLCSEMQGSEREGGGERYEVLGSSMYQVKQGGRNIRKEGYRNIGREWQKCEKC